MSIFVGVTNDSEWLIEVIGEEVNVRRILGKQDFEACLNC